MKNLKAKIFQYRTQEGENSILLGLNIGKNSLTFFYAKENKDNLINMLETADELLSRKKMGLSVVVGPTDEGHAQLHPCHDAMSHTLHWHLKFSENVTPALIDLYLNTMKLVEAKLSTKIPFLSDAAVNLIRTTFSQDVIGVFEPLGKSSSEKTVAYAVNAIEDKGCQYDYHPPVGAATRTAMVAQYPVDARQEVQNSFYVQYPEIAPAGFEPPAESSYSSVLIGAATLCCVCVSYWFYQNNNQNKNEKFKSNGEFKKM